MQHRYKTKDVCSQEITFELDGNIVKNVTFYGGCNGNLKAIAKLVDGWTVDAIAEKLQGNTCGYRSTSCADQLVKAITSAYKKEQGK